MKTFVQKRTLMRTAIATSVLLASFTSVHAETPVELEMDENIPANTAPIAMDDEFTVRPKQSTVINVLANDVDPDGDLLSYINNSYPSVGQLRYNYTNKTLTYTPNANVHDTVDSFTYSVSDGKTVSPPATVTLAIEALPNSLEALPDNIQTAFRKPVSFNVLDNDLNPLNGGTLRILSHTKPPSSAGTLTLVKSGSDVGKAVFTPKSNFSGQVSFTYNIENALKQKSTATANITVTPNTRPVAYLPIANYEVRINTPKQLITNAIGMGWGGDAEDGRITVPYRITQPANGRITQRNGQYFYTPRRGFVGNDSFSYTVRDSAGAVSEPAVVRFYVTATPSS